MSESPVNVVFRAWKDGAGVIALFPDIPADRYNVLCQSYEHVGQHGGADYESVMFLTRKARPEEYADLLQELESIGYRMVIKSRRSWTKTR
jgi:hypothetical protein